MSRITRSAVLDVVTSSLLTSYLAFGAMTTPAKAAKPFFMGLGSLTSANGVSADGSVVTGHLNYENRQAAFRWTFEGGVQELGPVPGGGDSVGLKVADDGTIVGLASSRSFIWTPDAGYEMIHEFGTLAYTISGDAKTVVGYALNAQFEPEAFRWTRNEGMVFLGDLPGGIVDNGASGVSQDGSFIVGMGTTEDRNLPAYWNSAGGPFEFGGQEHRTDLPTDVSADGSTVVAYAQFPGTSLMTQSRWTAETGFVDLGNIPGGRRGVAWAVSGDGSVIVGSDLLLEPFVSVATIWTEGNGVQPLRDVLATQYGLSEQLHGWKLEGATDVSTDGKFIVGGGTNPSGEYESWIVRIPEPSSMVLGSISAALAFTLTAMRRLRRRALA